MKNFTRTENFIIRVPDQDLYVLPVYGQSKEDPNVQELLKYMTHPEDRARLLDEHSIGEMEEFDLEGEYVLAVYLEETDQQMVLSSVLNEILAFVEEKGLPNVAIGQLGLIEYGYGDEPAWANFQSAKMIAFAKKHKGIQLTFVVPFNDSRPVHGKHLGEGIIPLVLDGKDDDEDLPQDEAHHHVSVPIKQVNSYVDYLRSYISAREKQMFQIRVDPGQTYDSEGIHNLKQLQANLAYYECRGGKKENFSKWNKPVKGKKTGIPYYPVPSKQKLKFIIVMLDMSYDEALECLHFFGYSLARFDLEDQAFRYILTHHDKWPKPLEVTRVNDTLKQQFGEKAALFIDHGKGREKGEDE